MLNVQFLTSLKIQHCSFTTTQLATPLLSYHADFFRGNGGKDSRLLKTSANKAAAEENTGGVPSGVR
jgi:hypothetical protein